MNSTAPKSKTTTRKRGRPKVNNPQVDKRATYLKEADGRRLNRYLREKGIESDAELLRGLLLGLLDDEGVEDPGPDSDEGKPLTNPRSRKSTDIARQDCPEILANAA